MIITIQIDTDSDDPVDEAILAELKKLAPSRPILEAKPAEAKPNEDPLPDPRPGAHPHPVEPETEEEEAKDETSLQTAIDRASELISEGRKDDVKAALIATGARKVSELGEDDIDTFLKALSDAG